MDKINPIAITDAILTGCNVPEIDYQEYDPSTAYVYGDYVMLATYAANIHNIYQCKESQAAGLTADLLDENCVDASLMTLGGNLNGLAEVSPTGQFRLDANTHGLSNYASVQKAFSTPAGNITIQIKTYFDALGTLANLDFLYMHCNTNDGGFYAKFCSNGLYITSSTTNTQVGSSIVKCNALAAWQTWRFEVTGANVQVWLKEENGEWASQGTFSLSGNSSSHLAYVYLLQYGQSTDNIVSHIDYLKIANGIGLIKNTDDTPAGNSDWLQVGSTNRWRAFNAKFGAQTEQTTKIEYVLTPGAALNSIALLNQDSDSNDIVLIDSADNLVANGTAWTGATGTTPPNSWNKVGSPSAYLIDSGMIKITADAANEGMSQTIAVSANTEYQLLFLYKNTSGDTAQYGIYDASHSADIVATTDLGSSTVVSSFSKVFTTPAGCTSITIKFMAKANTDIIWFDTVILAPTKYNETVTTGTTITDVVKMDLPEIATCILTITINKSGTAAIGELIIGNSTYLGEIEYGVQCGIDDYSTIDLDTWGNYDITERGYAKKMTCSLLVENTAFDALHKTLAADRAKFRVWVGSELYTSMIIYGKYDNFNMVMPGPEKSSCALEIIGLTSGE